jgi:hypothetical protein
MTDFILPLGWGFVIGYVCYRWGFSSGAQFTLKEFDRCLATKRKLQEKNNA